MNFPVWKSPTEKERNTRGSKDKTAFLVRYLAYITVYKCFERGEDPCNKQ